MPTLLPEGKQSFTNSSGAPLVGGKLYTYNAGTSVPRPTYQDAAGTVPNTNPVTLDARGEATVFWSGSYKVVLKDASEVTVWTVDNVIEPDASTLPFMPAGLGAVLTTIQLKLRERVSVLGFGADPTGVDDSTAAFNLATRSTEAHGGNGDLSMRRDIYVPPGDYKILGTVYVRKGQTLRGAGDGVTRITIGPTTSTGRVIFNMGVGLISGVVTPDPGGLPPVVEQLHVEGGDSIGAVVECSAAGAQIRDLFLTSSGRAMRISGGDIIVSGCFVDQSLGGILVSGQNHIFSDCLFYQSNFGITVTSDSFDVQVNNCHFEYSAYNDILIDDGATNIKNISISDCQFVKNVQYATSTAGINLRSNGAEVNIRDCDFRNQYGYSIAVTNGVGNIVRVSDCTFNGLKTVTGYIQSTTASGINTRNGIFEITNCEFKNLFGPPILMPHTFNYQVTVCGCTFRNNTGTTSHISLTSTAGTLEAYNNRGDDVLPLFNMQSSTPVRARGNKRWLGAPSVSAGRRFWLIPTNRAAIVQVGIVANTNSAGNVLYRHAIAFYAARKVEFNAVVVTDYATEAPLYATPTSGFAPIIDAVVEFDSVGAGATLPYVTAGRNLLVSIPDTYTDYVIEADYIASI